MICHRRWQTMLNRGWSVSVTCGSQMHHICSASKMSNIIVPLRGTYYGVHFPQAAPQRGLPAVKHGSAPSALILRPPPPCGAYQIECKLSESATALRLCVWWHRIRPTPSLGGVVGKVDAMTCEACEAETQARLIARGKRSATPGCHHPHLPASV